MAMHTPAGGTAKTKWALTRPAIVGASSADAGTFDEVTYPVATYGIPCATYDTVLVSPSFTGGGTVVFEAMFYDEDALIWIHWVQAVGGNNVTPALRTGEAFELKVYGRIVFFRFLTPVGTVTNLEITIAPGAPRLGGFFK